MRIESMRARSYRSIAVDEDVPAEAAERFRTLEAYDRLREAGCGEEAALEQIGISRRTLYRWKAALAAGGQRGLAPKPTRPRRVRRPQCRPKDVRAVLDVRRRYPFMGKARIHAVLVRRGVVHLSVSAVGRILGRALEAGAIAPASVCEGRLKPKRRRSFAKAWAKRWKYGSRAAGPGELVQVDHMTYAGGGATLKEFRAVCPVSRFMAARVYSRATAGNARRFLADLVEAMPFPVLSIQTDGGSEFMAEFEEGCEELGIPLRPLAVGHVLPPRRPQWNGCVERANRSAKAEFWNLYDGPLTVSAVTEALSGYEFFHNYERPHESLDYRTPNEYVVAQEAA